MILSSPPNGTPVSGPNNLFCQSWTGWFTQIGNALQIFDGATGSILNNTALNWSAASGTVNAFRQLVDAANVFRSQYSPSAGAWNDVVTVRQTDGGMNFSATGGVGFNNGSVFLNSTVPVLYLAAPSVQFNGGSSQTVSVGSGVAVNFASPEKIAFGSWTSYTPSFSLLGGSLLTYTLNGANYLREGQLVHVNIDFSFTVSSASGLALISGPFGPVSVAAFQPLDCAVNGSSSGYIQANGLAQTGSAIAVVGNFTTGQTWRVYLNGSYRWI